MKNHIEVLQYSDRINQALPRGVLLTTAADGAVNTMTIGWGHIGIEWSRPVFVAYVRRSRHTTSLLERNGEFTVNIPVGAVDPEILKVCGSRSGRDLDKIRTLGLHPVEGEKVSVPGIRELPLTLECRVIFTQEQDSAKLPEEIREKYYPDGRREDDHVAYYGQILSAYVLEEDQ